MQNNTLNLSLLIKTFIRPQCLENILWSIEEYQKHYAFQFENIIIIDDSDEENKTLNKEIVSKYKDLVNITYKEYEFNTLGLSKGRNEGIKEVKTKYFLLCDDDFILDKECSIEQGIKLLEEKDLDILGGHYRDVETREANEHKKYNWLGFINENENFDLVNIFSDFYPQYCHCDIVENFYIARTDSFKEVQYPEDMPVLEHNVFFLRAKQKGLKIAYSNDLWVKHLHITNKKKSYEGYRNRKVINPIKKEVIGFYHGNNKIIRFYDYLNINTNDRYEKKKKAKRLSLNLGLIKLELNYAPADKIYKKIKNKLKNKN